MPEGKLKHAEKDKATHEVCFEIQNTMHHIPVLKEVNLIENWQEEEKIAIKKPVVPKPAEAPKADAPKADAKPEDKKNDDAKPAEPEAPKEPETVQEFETKLKKKQTTSSINFSFSFFGMVPEDIKKGVEAE